MAEAAGLDDGRVDPEDLVQGARGAGVEPRVRRQEHQVRAELPRPPHQHPPGHSRRLRLGREGQDRSPVCQRRRHGDRPAPESRGHQPLHRGTESRRVDENDGFHPGDSPVSVFIRYILPIHISAVKRPIFSPGIDPAPTAAVPRQRCCKSATRLEIDVWRQASTAHTLSPCGSFLSASLGSDALFPVKVMQSQRRTQPIHLPSRRRNPASAGSLPLP